MALVGRTSRPPIAVALCVLCAFVVNALIEAHNSGANPRRMVFSQMARGSTKCSR